MTQAASLAMYARPELDAAHAALWTQIRAGLAEAGYDPPAALDPNGLGMAYWQRPDLLLSQTCGYPYRAGLHGHVQLVGTPDYGLADCPPGHYRSVFVVRKDSAHRMLADLDGAVMAFNEVQSQSGYQGPLTHAHGAGVTLQATVETGAHRLSARAVAEGKADCAALDALTWRLMQRFGDAEADALRVLTATQPVPGLPLICAQDFDAGLIFDVVSQAIATLAPAHRAALSLRALVPMGPDRYTDAAFARA